MAAQAPPADDDEEALVFNVEDVQKIVRDNIEMCLGGNTYSHSRSPQWISVITEKILARLAKLNKPFKYILRITITQKKRFRFTHSSSLLLGHSY
ncbi:unnamed protein product [Arctia plantaginis]|uniref:Uncharacterized protein n=1 Tax=Arctia plantaginis TaxID=874455 RepID=A0A8S1A1V2_ARCPL|nr:unnamed protein product [Arctia plantaginis]